MFRNYIADPARLTNQPTGDALHTRSYTSSSRGRYPYRGHGRFQGRYQRESSRERRERQEKYEERRKAKQESYVDYDSLADTKGQKEQAKGTERTMLNYDDL